MAPKLCFEIYINGTENVRNVIRIRVVNGPTTPGPNPKTNLKPKSCPKKTKVTLGLKNLALSPIYFEYIFVHLRQKVRLRPELSPKFLSTLGPKSPA